MEEAEYDLPASSTKQSKLAQTQRDAHTCAASEQKLSRRSPEERRKRRGEKHMTPNDAYEVRLLTLYIDI